MSSIHMLKMSGDTIIELFFKIFENYLICGIFRDDGKKEKLYQFLKKETKKTSKTIAQSFFFQSVARFSNASYTITC